MPRLWIVSMACAPAAHLPEQTDAQPSNGLTLEVAIEECSRLIGGGNGGQTFVEQTTAKANSDGKPGFEATAKALESVVRTILESPYRVPDLQRLSGFYAGVATNKSAVLREMAAAYDKDDKTGFDKAAAKLDELGKQYYVTAKAKGLTPSRALLKYPFRMSLNPFVADIGNLLPHLVSGSVLVSLVLSLPTVGPLLLEALPERYYVDPNKEWMRAVLENIGLPDEYERIREEA